MLMILGAKETGIFILRIEKVFYALFYVGNVLKIDFSHSKHLPHIQTKKGGKKLS